MSEARNLELFKESSGRLVVLIETKAPTCLIVAEAAILQNRVMDAIKAAVAVDIRGRLTRWRAQREQAKAEADKSDKGETDER
jgi:hypothetical protein